MPVGFWTQVLACMIFQIVRIIWFVYFANVNRLKERTHDVIGGFQIKRCEFLQERRQVGLQKVPVAYTGVELSPEKQIRIVTEGLKNLALAHRVPIVAIGTSDTEGLKNERVRFQDL